MRHLALAALLSLLSLPSAARADDGDSTDEADGRPKLETLRGRRIPIRPMDPTAEPVVVRVHAGTTTVLHPPAGLLVRAKGTGIPRAERDRPFSVLVNVDRDRVFITPRRPLAPEERFPFLLRCQDDTVIPVSLEAVEVVGLADSEARLVIDTSGVDELRVQLASLTSDMQSLQERLRAALRTQDSEDYALALLLSQGSEQLTALVPAAEKVLVDDERGSIRMVSYVVPAARHGSSKVAVVFHAANRGSVPMELSVLMMSPRSTMERVPFAARGPAEVPPGRRGAYAVVFDRSAFRPGPDPEVAVDLLVRRGSMHTSMTTDLYPEDYDPAAVGRKASFLWPLSF